MPKTLTQQQKPPATQLASGLGSKKTTQTFDLNAVMLSNSIAHVSTSQTGSQPQHQSSALQQVTPGHEGRQSDQVVSISPKMPKERKEGPNGDVTFANQNATYARGKFHLFIASVFGRNLFAISNG